MNWKKLLHELNLWYFPEFAPRGPIPQLEITNRAVPKAESPKLKHVQGRAFEIKEDQSWERYRPKKGSMKPGLTERDLETITLFQDHPDYAKRLKRDKYANIKACMATGVMSQEEASAYLDDIHGGGYKIRTVQKYWSAIGKTHEGTPLSA